MGPDAVAHSDCEDKPYVQGQVSYNNAKNFHTSSV